MKRGTLVQLTGLLLAGVVFACRDLVLPTATPGPDLASAYLEPTGRVVVYPDNMRGWAFYDDQQSVACTDGTLCRMVQGPAGTPAGTGSAELATRSASDGVALVLVGYKGVRLSQLTTLRYATYRQSPDPGDNLAIALQLNVDFDLSDDATGYQGRLVFEPYQGNGGGVKQGQWQDWDAKAGRWWGTRATVLENGASVANACVQSTPCTWTQLTSAFPNLGIHATYGAVVLKAGSGWPSFRGNADELTIGIDGVTTTYDFELVRPRPVVPASPPESISTALKDSLEAPSNVLENPPGVRGRWIRNVLLVAFKPSATQADRQAAIDAVEGEVVGGLALGAPEHYYIVRIPYVLAPGDSVSGPMLRARATIRSMPVIASVTLVPMDDPVSQTRGRRRPVSDRRS